MITATIADESEIVIRNNDFGISRPNLQNDANGKCSHGSLADNAAYTHRERNKLHAMNSAKVCS